VIATTPPDKVKPMNGYNTDAWESLFVTEAGVAAVLAGLLFVAVSINLAKVLQHPGLPGRAAEAVGLLVGVLVACTLGLVPGQSRTVLGAELLAIGLLSWLVQVSIHLHAARHRLGPSTRVLIGRIALAQAAVLPLPISGVSLLLGAGGGLYWLVPAVTLSVVVAVLDAWVLLIEIQR
jgi:hypothetical protein